MLENIKFKITKIFEFLSVAFLKSLIISTDTFFIFLTDCTNDIRLILQIK